MLASFSILCYIMDTGCHDSTSYAYTGCTSLLMQPAPLTGTATHQQARWAAHTSRMQPAPLTGTEAFIKPPKPPRYRDPWICHLLADVINVHYRGNNAPPHRRAAGFLFDPGPVTGCPPARAPLPGPAERPGPVPARPRAGRPTRWPRCGSARRRTPGTAGLPDAPPAAGPAGPA